MESPAAERVEAEDARSESDDGAWEARLESDARGESEERSGSEGEEARGVDKVHKRKATDGTKQRKKHRSESRKREKEARKLEKEARRREKEARKKEKEARRKEEKKERRVKEHLKAVNKAGVAVVLQRRSMKNMFVKTIANSVDKINTRAQRARGGGAPPPPIIETGPGSVQIKKSQKECALVLHQAVEDFMLRLNRGSAALVNYVGRVTMSGADLYMAAKLRDM